ncbi:MAG: hypothetical protein ACU83N_13865 [Gammaproteobacteria bacterium]
MTRMPDWLAPVQRSKAVFRGGKAPARWLRALIQKTEGVSTIAQCGAWTKAFGGIYFRVCEGLWFGRTLALLTGQTPLDQDGQTKFGRQGKGYVVRPEKPPEPKRAKTAVYQSGDAPFQPEPPNNRTATKYKALEATVPGRSVAVLSTLQARSDRSLLNRLAGDKFSFARPSPEQARSSSAKAGIDALFEGAEQGRFRSFTVMQPDEMRFPPLRPDASVLREWLGSLAQRAGQAVADKQPITGTRSNPAQQDERLPEFSSTLRGQWALPVEGACASRELLNRLVQQKIQGDEDRTGAASSRVSRIQEPSFSDELKGFHPVDRPEKSFTHASGIQWASFARNIEFDDRAWSQRKRSERSDGVSGREGQGASGGPGLSLESEPPVTAQKNASPLTTERLAMGQADDGETQTTASAPDVQPGMTASIAAHQAAQRTGVQPPSSAAWRGERAEEMKAMDEMDELAEKIKRILEDQARRHGIDI